MTRHNVHVTLSNSPQARYWTPNCPWYINQSALCCGSEWINVVNVACKKRFESSVKVRVEECYISTIISRKWVDRYTHPRVVHSISGSSPCVLWDGLFGGCCPGPGSVGQESTPPASTLSLFCSRTSWSAISFWMSVLTSKLFSQPCTGVSVLWRDREKSSHEEKMRRDRKHFLMRHPI